MAETGWIVLYDASREGPSGLIFPLVGLGFVAATIIGVRVKHIVTDENGESKTVRGSPRARLLLWLSVAWTILTASLIAVPYLQLVRALRNHHYQLIEGAVENYVEADLLRKTPEKWTVRGHHYQFSDSNDQPGLSAPGVVRSGMYVRIADVGGSIARVEERR